MPLPSTRSLASWERLPTEGPSPLFVFDAGYDPTQLQEGLG